MTGGAITATITAGAAGFYNPAGVAGGASNSVDVGANAYGLRLYQVDQLVVGPMGEHQGERVIDWVIAPTLLSYVRKLSRRWNAAFGLFVPKTSDFALQTRLDTVEGGRWLVTRAERHNEYYAGGTAALRVAPALRLWAESARCVQRSRQWPHGERRWARAAHGLAGRAKQQQELRAHLAGRRAVGAVSRARGRSECLRAQHHRGQPHRRGGRIFGSREQRPRPQKLRDRPGHTAQRGQGARGRAGAAAGRGLPLRLQLGRARRDAQPAPTSRFPGRASPDGLQPACRRVARADPEHSSGRQACSRIATSHARMASTTTV